jgi:nucleoside-diphosphate-sugar epimerase
VNVLVRDPHSQFVPIHPNIKIIAGCIANAEEVKNAMKNCGQVYHTAAEIKVKSATLFDTNVNGTKNILDAAIREGVSKMVFTSTCAILGDYDNAPVTENDYRTTAIKNDYELSKSIAGKMVLDYSLKGLDTVTVSLSKIFGPGLDRRSPGMMSMIARAMDGKLIFLPGPAPVISNFIFIEDALRGLILAMRKGKSGENYIIGGENLTFNEFFNIAASFNNIRPRFVSTPLLVSKMLAGCSEAILKLIGKDPLVTPAAIIEMYRPKAYSSEKAICELGYTITPVEEALYQTIQFIKYQANAQQNILPDIRQGDLSLPS